MASLNLLQGPSLSAAKVSVVAIVISRFIWEEGSDSKLIHIVVGRIQFVSGCGTKFLSYWWLKTVPCLLVHGSLH